MEREDSLRKLVAEFFETEPAQIAATFRLSGRRMQGSLARAKLDAAIRRLLGVKSAAVYSAQTYGELEAAVLGKAASRQQPESADSFSSFESVAAPSPVSHQGTSPTLAISCGIDIELVDKLPQPKDYWEDEFYKACFTPAEIAYCLTREHPRMHLAARWCVKEALKKCDSAYLKEDMSTIEVTLDSAGVPFICHRVNGTATRLPYAVSLSHTETMAAAVVIQQAPKIDQTPPAVVNSIPEAVPVELEKGSSGFIPTILSLIAVGLALWALMRTI